MNAAVGHMDASALMVISVSALYPDIINHDDKLSYQIRPEDKVVQLLLEKATIARLQEVDTLDDTERSPG